MEEAVARLAVPSASCLLLLGPAALAVRRRFYCEGLVFAFSSFFLAGWHACDGPDSLAWCALRPELLLYFSVYSEALSLWLSILAVGELGEPRRSTAAMLGALTTAIRVAQDPYGYGVYSGPIGGAVLIVATKFLRKMRQVKGLYPE
ncbi:protein myomaker-like, partial [Lampetra fluviatilis]